MFIFQNVPPVQTAHHSIKGCCCPFQHSLFRYLGQAAMSIITWPSTITQSTS